MNGSHFRSCALRFLLVAGLLALAGLAVRRGQGAALARFGNGPSALLSTGYGLSWWTVDGGGYTFSGDGDYALGGTIGQPDAGVMSDNGGTYTLSGGFWGGAGPVEHRIYLPLVLRGY
ncbi:MAG: hypothetical protein U9R72_13720 [Chloroflexota bacterium]|nr:hypothetical protein [Chloroflexota bacterium]